MIKSNTLYSTTTADINNDCNNSSSDEDYSDDEEEGEDGYRIGGYHPVQISDKFNNRYIVIEKLGWGHFSTVWRCYDLKTSTNDKPEYIALKIQKSASHYKEAAVDEIELLNCIKTKLYSTKNTGITTASEHITSINNNTTTTTPTTTPIHTNYEATIVTLVDNFEHLGRNGNHICMAFEILGENLLKVIKKYNYRGMPLAIVKKFTKQICNGLDFLHRYCNIIHTDLKPENILINKVLNQPDISIVKAIIGEKSSNNSNKTKKKKTTSSSNNNDITSKPSSALDTSADILVNNNSNNDENEKLLSPEQKKKLKKKMKKKRQLARKIEDKKQSKTTGTTGRNSRRKGRSTNDGNKRTATIDNSIEKAKIEEMLMMERASVPISMRPVSTSLLGEHLEDDQMVDEIGMDSLSLVDRIAPGKGKLSTNPVSSKDIDSSGDKHHHTSSTTGSGKTYKSSGYIYSKQTDSDLYDEKHQLSDSEFNDDNDADFKGSAGCGTGSGRDMKPYTQSRTLIKQSVCSEHERVFHALPQWARPTVFAYLNFDLLEGIDTSECTDFTARRHKLSSKKRPGPVLCYGQAVQILPEDYHIPPRPMQASITMVSTHPLI